jgi:O-antigen ligase
VFIEEKGVSNLEKIGWYLTISLTPFGQTYPGLLVLLISKIKTLFTQKKQKKERPLLPPLVKRTNNLFIALLIFMYVSGLFSQTRLESLLLALAFTLLFFFFYFGGQRIAYHNQKLIDQSLFLLFISSSVASLAALIRFCITDFSRATLFEGPNSLGTLIVMYTGITVGYLFSKGKPYRILTLPYLLLSTAAVLATQSRGAWLGFAGMLFSLLIFNRNQKLTLAIVIIVLIASFVVLINPLFQERLFSIFSLEKGGNMARIHIWQASLEMVKDHPVFGLGLGVFPFAFPAYDPADVEPERTFAYAHNLFLQIAAELGVIGFIIFFLTLTTVFYMAFSLAKSGNYLYQGLFASLVGVLIHQQVDIPIWKMHIGISFWLFIGMVVGFYHLKENSHKSQ